MIRHQSWRLPQFKPGESELIRELVRKIGQRLRRLPYVLKMGQISSEQSGYHLWASRSRLYSLAQGPLGLAFLFHELDDVLPNEGWDQAANEYFSPFRAGVPLEGELALGLFSGACGFLLVAHRLAERGGQQQEAYQQALGAILPEIIRYAGALVRDEYPRPENYDLTSGAVGLGATLLMLRQTAHAPEIRALLSHGFSALIRHLAWLGQRNVDEDVRHFAHWYHSPALRDMQLRWQAADHAYPGYGISRGLAGPIALLSLVLETHATPEADDTASALRTLAQRVLQGMQRDTLGWYWPQEQAGHAFHRSGKCALFSWCNGMAGIARALWLAGRALDDSNLRTVALECVAQIGQRFAHDPLAPGPSLCHGLAGVLHVCARFAVETGDAALAEPLYTMTHRLFELFEADRPFGYRAFEPEYIRIDSPWLLEGASGVALALTTLVRADAPTWDRLLLLA